MIQSGNLEHIANYTNYAYTTTSIFYKQCQIIDIEHVRCKKADIIQHKIITILQPMT